MPPRPIAFALALLALFAIALRFAWLGDDAYITLRSVENWCSGFGLRWNTADRVSINTHPLWTVLLAGCRWLTGEVYFGTITVSLLIATLATALWLRRARTFPALLALTVLLATTRAFGEYSTSGLETPLTFLLLALFCDAVVDPSLAPHRRLAKVALLATLSACNRLDLGLLCAPAVLSLLPAVGLRVWLWRCACAGLPLLGWLAFAFVYFGAPFPVVAYAKAFGGGIPALEVASQGLQYLAFAAVDDPVLLATTACGIGLGLLQRATRWLAFGALLYLAYVVKVGGDFMAGRFLLPSFTVAIAALTPWLSARSARTAAIPIVLALAAVIARGGPAWCSPPSADTRPSADVIGRGHGIVDERRMHYDALGLLSPTRSIPVFGAMEPLAFPGGRTTRWFLLNGSVGTAGYQLGERGHMVDPILCDPLLARLPAQDPRHWRIGHVLRRAPEGYWESLASGENRIRHPGLREYYGALRTLTQAPVLDGQRLAVAWRMAFGGYDEGLRAFVATDYRTPPRVSLAQRELANDDAPGTFWFDCKRPCLVYEGGVSIGLDGQTHTAKELRLLAFGAPFFDYRVRFLNDGPVVGDVMAVRVLDGAPPSVQLGGACAYRVDVPPGIAFDTVWIDRVETPVAHLMTGPSGLASLELR